MTWTSMDSEELARELLYQSSDRWSHTRLVALTVGFLAGRRSDRDALTSAGWLHDVGYAPQLVDTGMHAIDGAAFLDREGVPVEIVSLVAFHTGAEFEADERVLSTALLQFERPPQDQLDLLNLADLTSSPSGQPTRVEDRLDEILRRYGPQHPVHRAVTRSRPYLEECAMRARNLVQPT